MQCPGQLLREVGVGGGIRRCRVPYTRDVVLHRMNKHVRYIVHVNPRHTLAARSKSPADSSAKYRQQLSKCAAIVSEHEADSQLHYAETEFRGTIRFGFP